jgi:hypothetical protein
VGVGRGVGVGVCVFLHACEGKHNQSYSPPCPPSHTHPTHPTAGTQLCVAKNPLLFAPPRVWQGQGPRISPCLPLFPPPYLPAYSRL